MRFSVWCEIVGLSERFLCCELMMGGGLNIRIQHRQSRLMNWELGPPALAFLGFMTLQPSLLLPLIS